MAKKRQRKKVYKPPPPKLETQFNCPECGRKKVVEVHFEKRENKGYLRCRACGEENSTENKIINNDDYNFDDIRKNILMNKCRIRRSFSFKKIEKRNNSRISLYSTLTK